MIEIKSGFNWCQIQLEVIGTLIRPQKQTEHSEPFVSSIQSGRRKAGDSLSNFTPFRFYP